MFFAVLGIKQNTAVLGNTREGRYVGTRSAFSLRFTAMSLWALAVLMSCTSLPVFVPPPSCASFY